MIIKICGITRPEDAVASADAGASALGFNFWPRSPRYVDPASAASLLASVPKDIWKVGIFVDDPAEHVAAVAKSLALDIVQLHGRAQAPANLRIWRGWNIIDGFHPDQLPGGVDAFVFDAPAGALHGGTGRVFDWSHLSGARCRFLLAGGLEASNVADAIRQVRPWGVDACSRLESAPGKKDAAKVRAFVDAARAAAKESELTNAKL